jgi:hypothetical protein
MYRSIGINLDKETNAILKHKKLPYLNHSTSLGSNREQSTNFQSSSSANASDGCCKDGMNIEFSVNGHQYKMEKKNLMALGIGAIATIGAYKAYKYFTEI